MAPRTGANRPSPGKRNEPRAAAADRRPVVVGGRSGGRVKVERERSDRTLRRPRGADRRGRRKAEVDRVHSWGRPGSGADRPRGWEERTRSEKEGGRRSQEKRRAADDWGRPEKAEARGRDEEEVETRESVRTLSSCSTAVVARRVAECLPCGAFPLPSSSWDNSLQRPGLNRGCCFG